MKTIDRLDTKQRGSIINIVLLVLVILTLVGFVLMRSTRMDTQIAANEKQEVTAFYAADAGLSRALNMLDNNGDDSWLGSPFSVGDATYQVTIIDYSVGGSSSGSSSGSSTMLDDGFDTIWNKIVGFFVSPAYADYDSSSSGGGGGSSSSGGGGGPSVLDNYDTDGDGYVMIRTTGTINKAKVVVEAIYQEGTGMISWKQVE